MLTEIMGNFAAKLSYSTLSRFATFCLILSSFDHHGCESRAGQESPAKSLPPGTYIAELPNNIQVELVALAPGASKRNDEPIWWMPDGRALDVAPKYAGGQIDGNVPPYVRSVIHVHGIRESHTLFRPLFASIRPMSGKFFAWPRCLIFPSTRSTASSMSSDFFAIG